MQKTDFKKQPDGLIKPLFFILFFLLGCQTVIKRSPQGGVSSCNIQINRIKRCVLSRYDRAVISMPDPCVDVYYTGFKKGKQVWNDCYAENTALNFKKKCGRSELISAFKEIHEILMDKDYRRLKICQK